MRTFTDLIFHGAAWIAWKTYSLPKSYKENSIPYWDDIKKDITTGSILLCSGTARTSRLIARFQGTDFSHTSMIVKKDGEFYIWTTDSITILKNHSKKLNGQCFSGAHMLKLEDYFSNVDYFYKSPDDTKYRFAIVKMKANLVNEEELFSLIDNYTATPFPAPPQQLLYDWILGQIGINTGLKTAFCSQLLAHTYFKLGWLKESFPANQFGPGVFAKTERINTYLNNSIKLYKPQYFRVK
ncbi:hypothetical protein [Parendozoicomonas sp. Alg238-R29]|uniref:hypothetical protein n=1 Tax=Parendozoicomonas sp. Alg238-R29 TaxID=2993446 RepID=UPI00248E048D|nr:hypothetical protein [Parendozoicomonas sp. Alg238-R29]